MTISSSPQRNSFQKENYLKRQAEEGKTPENDKDVSEMLEFYNNWKDEKSAKEADTEWQKDNLEWDLRSTDWILEKARNSKSYAQNLYAAMCNNDFQRAEMWPILTDKTWSCSWRYAGGIIADMRQDGDYIDWYCSGIGGRNAEYDSEETNEQWQARTKYVSESVVTEEIEQDLARLGWIVIKS